MPDSNGTCFGNSSRFRLLRPGLMRYSEALELQLATHAEVKSGMLDGSLILVEHFPVLTLGMSAHAENILASEDLLKAQGIEVVKTDRGGDVTYHGPGQLVGYPIINLRSIGSDVHGFLRLIEEVVMSTLSHFGLTGRRNGPAGVWVEDKKICSIGIAVRGGVTYHGFALNVKPNLAHFQLINPCGLKSEQITSLEQLISPPPDMDAVCEQVAEQFERCLAIGVGQK